MSAQPLAPRGITLRRDLAIQSVSQLPEDRLDVADHSDIQFARTIGDLARIDIHPDDRGIGVEARRGRMADDVIHARAEHEDHIGFAEGGRTRRKIAIVMILWNDTAALRGRVERNAGGVDETLQFIGRIGPKDTRT